MTKVPEDENTLHTACERGDIETVKLLIDKGADVYQRNRVRYVNHAIYEY